MSLTADIDQMLLPNEASCPTCGHTVRMFLDMCALEHKQDGHWLVCRDESCDCHRRAA